MELKAADHFLMLESQLFWHIFQNSLYVILKKNNDFQGII